MTAFLHTYWLALAFTAYALALTTGLLVVVRVTFRDDPSSACMSPTPGPASPSPARDNTGHGPLTIAPGGGRASLRLCDELDSVVVRLDEWRSVRGLDGAA